MLGSSAGCTGFRHSCSKGEYYLVSAAQLSRTVVRKLEKQLFCITHPHFFVAHCGWIMSISKDRIPAALWKGTQTCTLMLEMLDGSSNSKMQRQRDFVNGGSLLGRKA
eukprot:1137394-Pelagomonas_calceolata.AAC.2